MYSNLKTLFLCVVLAVALTLPVAGQTGVERLQEVRQRRAEQNNVPKNPGLNDRKNEWAKDPKFRPRYNGPYSKDPAVEELLRPSESQLKNYEEFLKIADTGIARLRPSESSAVVSVSVLGNEQRVGSWHASYYSFSLGGHVPDIADLRFVNGYFRTGVASPPSFGAFADLGQAPIKDVTLESQEAKKLLGLKLPSKKGELSKLMRASNFMVKVKDGGLTSCALP